MRVDRPLPLLLGLSCLTVGLSGCGSSGLLDGSSAAELRASVSNVQQAVADGRCDEAQAAAGEGLIRVEQLPSSVDAALVDNLRTGFQRLQATAREDCTEATPTVETLPPTETEPAPPVTTEETPPTDTVPDTTETPPATTDETPPETAPDGEGGPGPGTGAVPPGEEDSGGTAPGGVDGPQGAPRSRPDGIRGTGRRLGHRVQQAVRDAMKHLPGGDR